MMVTRREGQVCEVDITADDPAETLMHMCRKPSVARFVNWAGRTTFVCREHAEQLQAELSAILEKREAQ